MAGVKIKAIKEPKISTKATSKVPSYKSPTIRPKSSSSKVTNVRPGTIRVMPKGLSTTLKHPGQAVKTGGHGTLKTVKKPR